MIIVKKGAIVGLGAGCFVVVFAIAVLALGGSNLTLTQNEVPTRGIEEIQSEFDYIRTLPRTEASVENIIGPLFEEMLERPSVIDTCTKMYNLSIEASFELAETDDYYSDDEFTFAELDYAIEEVNKLIEYEEVSGWCVLQVQIYPDKFPDVISNEEVQQRIIELQDKK